jgi:hypothetical protein
MEESSSDRVDNHVAGRQAENSYPEVVIPTLTLNEKYLSTLKPGKKGEIVMFEVNILDGGKNTVLMAGLYPPAKAHSNQPLNNRTSTDVLNATHHTLNLSWIDGILVSAANSCEDVDQHMCRKMLVTDQEVRHNYIGRTNIFFRVNRRRSNRGAVHMWRHSW